MTGYLLDTHIWFWYLIGSSRLPPSLRKAIDGSLDRCWLSPISIWELGMLQVRGRVRITGDFRQWIAQAQHQFPVKDAPLNSEIALVSHEIRLPHRDPADHFLAATALVYGFTLATVDRHLVQADWLPTLST